MRRDLAELSGSTFDVVIVGGGVLGAALTFEAARSGLRTALVQADDFAEGASSNSLKILHGGFRYLQSANLARMRSSIAARSEWCRLMPSLVAPLPCVVQTRGMGTRSRLALATALAINDALSFDRNAGLEPQVRLPRGGLISAAEFGQRAGQLWPACEGAQWWDAVSLNTEAMVMWLIESATRHGALVANYLRADVPLSENGTNVLPVQDRFTGKVRHVRASRILMATGSSPEVPARSCWGINVILETDAGGDGAVALTARSADGPSRQLFFVPWRNRLMLGTHYVPCLPGQARPAPAAIRELVSLALAAAPGLGGSGFKVSQVHWGRLPVSAGRSALALDASLRLEPYGAVDNCWLVQGPKFTTALSTARWTLRRVVRDWRPATADPLVATDLLNVLGTDDPFHAARLCGERLMATSLQDVITRRTGLGSAGQPADDALEASAAGLGAALDWDSSRKASEVAAVRAWYAARLEQLNPS